MKINCFMIDGCVVAEVEISDAEYKQIALLQYTVSTSKSNNQYQHMLFGEYMITKQRDIDMNAFHTISADAASRFSNGRTEQTAHLISHNCVNGIHRIRLYFKLSDRLIYDAKRISMSYSDLLLHFAYKANGTLLNGNTITTFWKVTGNKLTYGDLSGEEILCVPSTINGTDITTIGRRSFNFYELIDDKVPSWYPNGHAEQLSCLIIGNGILTIEEEAFCGFENLHTVILPPSITSIAKFCFYKSPVKKVFVPSQNIAIDKYAFGPDILFYMYLH